MKTILVAGAGHGGLCAAIHLARQGFDVTVVEKQKRDALGYDWHDAIRRNSFPHADLPDPPQALLLPGKQMCYRSPGKRTCIVSPNKPGDNNVFINRRGLVAHLLHTAEQSGVRLLFEKEVLGAAIENSCVTGLRIAMRGGEQFFPADLVIDAAGMHSPVRLSLPKEAGIPGRIAQKDTFYAWRGYCAVREKLENDPPYSVCFYHCGMPGMDWVISCGTYADILIGAFRPMQQADIESRLADFRREYPQILDTLIAGGQYETIPLGYFLPVCVWNGYAAIGNSACMTEPLSGSGLDLSLRIGKLLAQTVAGCADFSAFSLWPYNRQVIHAFAERYYTDLLIRRFLTSLTAEEIDFLFDKKILTEKELGGHKGYTLLQVLQKGNFLRRPRLFAPLTQTLQKASRLPQVRQSLPQSYDARAVEVWKELYEAVLG